MSDKYVFHLFQSCVPVLASATAVLHDLERGVFYYIPRSMYSFLTACSGKTRSQIYSSFGESNKPSVTEYFKYLEHRELITWLPKQDAALFEPLSKHVSNACHISNIIIEFSPLTNKHVNNIAALVNTLQCQAAAILVSADSDMNECLQFAQHLNKTSIRCLHFIIDTPVPDQLQLASQLSDIPYLYDISFYHIGDAGEENVIELSGLKIRMLKNAYADSLKNFKAGKADFNVDIEMFFEAQSFNVYFNQKLFIAADLAIRNAVHTPPFSTLHELMHGDPVAIIKQHDQLWHISKNKIKGCRRCGHRYICQDTRVPVKTSGQLYHHQTSCGYDPATGAWQRS